ncbi:Unknown protein, partial [Striga hermonthica]
ARYHDRNDPRDDRAGTRPKIIMPTFTGTDPDAWLSRAVQFFEINDVPRYERVQIAAYHLDGEANVWWQWVVHKNHGEHMRWRDFEKELITRFGSSDYHDYNEALSRIKQVGSLRDYQKEFERIASRVRDWPEAALVGTFVGGLKAELAAEVRLDRPGSMRAAVESARLHEEHLVAVRKAKPSDVRAETKRTNATTEELAGRTENKPPATEVKRLTEDEMARRREKGLCFRCEEKYTPGHRCKQNFLIEFVDSDDEEPVIEEERKVEVEVLEDEAEISVHAMAGTKGPRTMRLPAWVKDQRVTVLVDNGSSHNFINATLSHKLKLPTSMVEPFEVRVANGERLRCSKVYRGVPIKFQGVTVKADLFALPLVGPDVVLGVQWLEGLGDVTTNYRKGVMKFETDDRLVTLKASKGSTKEVGLKNIEK